MILFNTLDQNYFNFAYNSLKSFYKYNNYKFIIFNVNLTEFQKLKLKNINNNIIIINNLKYKNNLFTKLKSSKYFTQSYIDNHVCCLFSNLEYLKNIYKNELFIKCDLDTIFLGSLKNIENINLENYHCAMCYDMKLTWYKANTYNGGFVIFSNKYNFNKLFIEYLKNLKEAPVFLEQDFLNTLNSFTLDQKYNYHIYNINIYKNFLNENHSEIMAHFSGDKYIKGELCVIQ